MKQFRLIQISNGVGSGNIGDELMAQEFWRLLPGNVVLDVPVLQEAARYRGSYPALHRFFPVESPPPQFPDAPGLLVGDTPVAEFEGLGYPLRTVGRSISTITRQGLPVDAVSVGVDRLHSPEARQLFKRHYAAIRSWTVRSEACREALLDLGIPAERVRVAADLAWLFTPGSETDAWAAELWNRLGVRTDQPLLVVNIVHHVDPSDLAPKRVLAEALDRLAREGGYQIAFLHNESRTGPHFDAAAAAGVRAFMREGSVEVPAAYYTPQEVVSLLRPAATVLSQRYHMAIQGILAGTIPVCLIRGQKLSGLAREFDLLASVVEVNSIVERVTESAARRQDRIASLAEKREEHRVRAGEALCFFREHLAEGPPAPPRRAAVEHVVVIHLGGLGDLVLASTLFAALRRKYGKASIHLLCRAPFAGLAELFPSPPDRVIRVPFDPTAHSQVDAALTEALGALDHQFGSLQPDIVVTAELEPTWLSWYAASRWAAPVNLACTRIEAPAGLLPLLLREAEMAPVEFSGPAWHSKMIEGDRYAALAKALGIEGCSLPRWKLNAEQERQTAAFLEERGFRGGGYAVCFPLGAVSTLVKRWPAASFDAVLEQATDHFALPVLLTGESRERAALELHAADLRGRGATVAVFAGAADEIQLLAGLLAQANFFLGNDTGPAHLAQAYETPGAIVFGGGTWPHYRPWGPGAVGVVHPLPCFSCRWDCIFGQPVCIEGVTVEAVARALEQAKANPARPAGVVSIDSSVAKSIVNLATVWRTAAQERLVKLEELSRTHEMVSAAAANRAEALDKLDQLFHGAESDRESVQIAADVRLQLIETISKELADLRRENSARLATIERADDLLHEQEEEINVLRQGYAARLAAIEEANVLLKKQQQEIEELREGYAIRLVAIQEANVILRDRQQEVEQLREALGVRLVAIEEANVLLQKQQAEIVELREGHAARLVAIEEANALLQKQQAEIVELREGHAARLVAIEEANALLQKQQAEIVELREGHAARLVAIEEANALLQKQQAEIVELREGHAARLVAIEEANALLQRQQAEIVELREGHAARLVAIEEANALLQKQQEEIASLRGEIASLRSESAQRAARVQELDVAATERLAALQHANLLLAAAHAAKEEQGHQLRMFEQAAAERLTGLEATAASLRAEIARRSQLEADLAAVAAAQSESQGRQAEERESWQRMGAELRAELNRERAARRDADQRLALLSTDLDRATAERDRYRRSTEELALSEQELRRQILAAESETLLQSIFRRTTGKSH